MADDMQRLVVSLEARIQSFEKALNKATGIADTRTAQIERRFATANARISRSMTTAMSASVIANQRLVAGMSASGVAAGAAAAQINTLPSAMRSTTQAANGMGMALGTLGTYLTVDQVIGYANAWTRLTRSLDASEQTFGINLKSAEELNALANEARIDVEAYTKTYIRAAAAIRDYGFDSDTAAKVTSTLAKALKLGGAAASEQASTILQFSQALQKGKLDGDEFRTVMENAGVVQELLAKRLKVTKGEIVSMAGEGKLKLQDLVGAMTDGAEDVNRIFNQMPATIDEAFTQLNNSITAFIGKMDQTYGISQSVAGAMQFLAENIDTMGKAALVAGVGLLAMFAPAIIAGVVALGAGIIATSGGIGLLTGGIAAAAGAFELFGDQVTVAENGLGSLKDLVQALAEELPLEFEVKGLTNIKPFADRVRENMQQRALGRGFAESTTTTRSFPQPKIAPTPADKDAERARKSFEKDLLAVENRIALEKVEADTIGRSAQEVEYMRTKQELLNEARKAGVDLTDADMIRIEALAQAQARAVTEAENMRRAYEEVSSSSKEMLSGFVTELKDGTSATEALGNALNKIADKLIDMAANDLVETALGGLTGRGGNASQAGLSSGILKLLGFAEGGKVAGAGSGTSDSILARLSNGEFVVKASATRKYQPMLEAMNAGKLPKFADGGAVNIPSISIPTVKSAISSQSPVNVTVAPVFNMQNSTPESVSKAQTEMLPKVRDIVRAELASQFDRNPRFARLGV